MQTRFRLPILFLISAFVIFSSCSKKTNKEGRYIPATAAVVFMMNGESLTAKLPWEEIKQNSMFKDLDSSLKLDDYAKAAFENPENSGIDTKKNLLLFVEKDSLGGYMAFEGSIKDVAKFKEFSTKANKGGTETEKDGIHFISSPRMTSSWDKDKFVVLIDIPQMRSIKKYGEDNLISKRNVMTTITGIYNLSEGSSMGKNERFSELVGKPADMRFWVNVASFASDNNGLGNLSMLNVSKLYEESCLTGIVNFENGKINVDVKTYAGKELSDLYKKHSGSKLNTDMIKRIPAKDLAALVAISFKPEAVKEFAKLMGVDGLINVAAANLGFTFDDCLKALKGDVLLAVSDIKKDSSGKPGANVIFSATVADKNSFGKLLEAANRYKKEKLGDEADKYVSYTVNDNYFAAGTDKASVDKFMSSSNNSSYGFLDKISGSSSVFYINFPILLSGMSNELTRDSLDNIAYQASIKMWENVIATGEGFKDGGSNSHIEINLTDKNTNSLRQLNTFVATMSNIQKEKRLAREQWMKEAIGSDSTTVAVPAPQQ